VATYANATNINTPCSIQDAFDFATAGDVVGFRGGTYSYTGPGSVNGIYLPSNEGSLGSPIVFAAYQDETPIISIQLDISINTRGTVFAIYTNSKNYITVDGFTITTSNNYTAGIRMGSQTDIPYDQGLIVQNCTIICGSNNILAITDNADVCRMENTNGAIFRNNVITGARFDGSTDNGACLKMYDNDNAIIENNNFLDSESCGIASKRASNNCIIRYNWFHDCWQGYRQNSQIEDANGNTVHNNLFTSNATRTVAHISLDTASGWVADDLTIYNNTFFSATGIGGLIVAGQGERLRYYNNIVYVNQSPTFITRLSGGVSPTILFMDYNQWGGLNFYVRLRQYDNITDYTNLAAWQASGELIGGGNPGANDLASDPVFKNTSGNWNLITDFELDTGSPCIGAGQGGIDMGADLTQVGPQ
jgi:hypothetical protein